ncbi:hypothetical protein F5Y00DRAFT_265734 [Daldinia vernicosa]|uniref:uncharacterized protein n=1 Tax=Daldinia vernicosa TaxID=114800 RepID=UPI002008331E|nr:uncharacterized protein F5Y00DRAFT_265734 [Daldinia vernicosa]KAI0845331.1 hypothetical protein F5Y00DRAFT_265734 [Daldinia vernicosa]
MANQANSLPVVIYRKGISAEGFEEFLREQYQGVGKHVDDILTLLYSQGLLQEASCYYWQSFWKLMLHLFGCSPWDLTTWGLRIHSECKSPVMKELNQLLPHPIWEGNVDILRYVLQKTVLCRLGADIEPLGPLAAGIADVLISRRNPDATDMALEMWASTGPATNSNVMYLLELLSTMPEHSKQQQPWSTKPFVLIPRDVSVILQEYYDAFVKREMWPRGLATVDTKTIERWDKTMLAIKNRDYLLGEPDTRVGKERERHKALAYWESPNCHPGLKELVSMNTIPYIFTK